jgi:hypothetical protein
MRLFSVMVLRFIYKDLSDSFLDPVVFEETHSLVLRYTHKEPRLTGHGGGFYLNEILRCLACPYIPC